MSDTFVASGTSPTEQTRPDFFVENHGSIFLLRPVTPSAFDWISQRIPDDAQIFGNAVVVEHRYIADIVQLEDRFALMLANLTDAELVAKYAGRDYRGGIRQTNTHRRMNF